MIPCGLCINDVPYFGIHHGTIQLMFHHRDIVFVFVCVLVDVLMRISDKL